jgi:hypothetical protein
MLLPLLPRLAAALAFLPLLPISHVLMAQQSSGLTQSVDAQLPSLIETYKDFHRHPELSHQEEHTSAKLAADLRKLGYTVTERCGAISRRQQGVGALSPRSRKWTGTAAAHPQRFGRAAG